MNFERTKVSLIPKNDALAASNRRVFLQRVVAAAAAANAFAISAPSDAASVSGTNAARNRRRSRAYRLRHKAAIDQQSLRIPDHPSNGDEEIYPNFIGNFSKGL